MINELNSFFLRENSFNFILIDTDDEYLQEEESDDDNGFFPIDESIIHSSQSNNVTTTRTTFERLTTKFSTNHRSSKNYSHDNNFEYTGRTCLNILYSIDNTKQVLFCHLN